MVLVLPVSKGTVPAEVYDEAALADSLHRSPPWITQE
jgi:hypothetical protein